MTISWHVFDNDAWARIRLADMYNWENGCTEPEAEVDNTCGSAGLNQGELNQYLIFTLWMDQGQVPGWQCPINEPSCSADPLEGDNILNGVETSMGEYTINDLINGVALPEELSPDNTYYLGFLWHVAPEVGNIIQTDSITLKIIMEIVQSRNNPNPWL